MGEADKIGRKIVFLTVGTTSFDALVKTVDTQQVRALLIEKGYTDLIIQLGRGSFKPSKSTGEDGALVVDYFTFSPTIVDHLRPLLLLSAMQVGSGSIFETLHMGKPLIVVVNEDLMDNHQCELAEELAERKHLFYARPQTLRETLSNMDLRSLIPYPASDAMPVAKIITRFLGFPED